jgi:alpha-L-rhamnosidase
MGLRYALCGQRDKGQSKLQSKAEPPAIHPNKLSDAGRIGHCVRKAGCCITVMMHSNLPLFARMYKSSLCAQSLVLVLFVCIRSAGAAPQPGNAHLLRPSALRCDEKSEPLAVDDAHPAFSWRLSAASPSLHGVSESAYRIQVAAGNGSFDSAKNLLWDTGVVPSPASADVAYNGPALAAERAYMWRVEVWDEHKHASGWSAAAHWTQAPVWRAAWIAAPADNDRNRSEPMPIFRKAFTVDRGIARAVLYASGLGQDELRINGRKVGDDVLTPGWSDYRKTIYYDAYDVTALLRRGPNALGVMLGNGMYRVLHTAGRYTKFVGSYGELKLTVQLHIDFVDGGSAEILSDGTWKTTPGPITFSSTYGGEDYDARLVQPDWDEPGFNDGQWRAVVVVAGPGGALRPEIAPPIRVMHIYAPVKITQPKPSVRVYDLGQNFAGWPAIAAAGPAGATIKLIGGELLDANGMVTQRSSKGPQWYSYTLRGKGVESWHPRFSYWGFRYVQVESASGVRILSLRGEATHSSSEQVGEFSSSDPLLNNIHALILHAIENNAVSLFTDCPHREKLGWLEETHLLAPSMLYDFDFAGLYAATARNIADEQRTEGAQAGMVAEIAPQYVVFDPVKAAVFNDSPEWGSAAVLAPWYAYERDGDLRFLAAQYPVMRAYAAYLATRAKNGIVDYGLGDWYDIGPGAPGFSKLTSAGVTATAIYYQDLNVLEKTAALLGKNEESSTYAQQADAVRTAFNARFFDASHHIYDKGSQTAQAMPLALGMVPGDERAAVLNALVADIRAHQNHVTAGDIGYHYVVDALLDGGRSDVLLEMLERTDTPSYGYQLAQGATSLTEAWDANPDSSQDHFMLGDAEEWFYRGLGGINVDLSRAGAERLILRPAVVGNLAWVRTRYESALGMIESSWRRDADFIDYDFTIPPNATATIAIDSASSNSTTVNGVTISKASGVLSQRIDGKQIEIVVGSGDYRIHAANSAH